jgi:pimeloyl-ACP methyl ester carboxylesterase
MDRIRMVPVSDDTTGEGYVTVGDQLVWHQVHGSGHSAVVLLHGGFAGASSWGAQVPALVEAGFRVYVPERRGHGHTADVEGPMTYVSMASDTIDYLEAVVGTPSQLVGWSDGAVVAMMVAMRRPDLVARMVVIGQYFNRDGRLPDSALDRLLHGAEAMAFLRNDYDAVSPDGPSHFPVVYEKMLAMIDAGPELDLADLRRVATPALVLQGDRDEVTLEHGAAVAGALADGRLAVLPGTHALPLELPEVVNPLIVAFLQRGAPPGAWDLL